MADEQRRRRRFEKALAEQQRRAEGDEAADADDGEQLGQPQREPGLQDQPVEREKADLIIAAGGQAAFAAQLDQHALAVGAVLGDRRAGD